MGAVRLRGGLTPDQWIKSRIHLYYFLGFALLCVVAVIIFAIAMVGREPAGTATADLSVTDQSQAHDAKAESRASTVPSVEKDADTVSPPSLGGRNLSQGGVVRALAVRSDFDRSGGRAPYAPPELTVSYQYDRRGGAIAIFPTMPYLDLLKAGGPIRGFHYWWSPFAWQYPQISAEIVNNTKGSLFLNEVVVHVAKSDINLEPVIVVEENFYNVGNFNIINEGWGEAKNATLDFDILDSESCTDQPSLSATPQHIAVGSIVDSRTVAVASLVPASLRSEQLVCVAGKLTYHNAAEATRTILFRTRVSLVPPGPGAPAPPSYVYDIFLEAGKAGYVKRFPIAQKIAAGDVDHFLVRVGTDKSAHFELSIAFRGVGGVELAAPPVSLDVFVPRSQSGAAEQRAQVK
jgi:hypothetical protein